MICSHINERLLKKTLKICKPYGHLTKSLMANSMRSIYASVASQEGAAGAAGGAAKAEAT